MTEPPRGMPWKGRDLVEIGSALGGIVAWAGVVIPTALSYRRGDVPLLWWVLAVIVLGCFLALSGVRARTRVRDRVVLAVMIVAVITSCAVWGSDRSTPVLLVLSAGVAGWVVSTAASMWIVAGQTVALTVILALQQTTVVWAFLYGALMFFAALMVHVVVREAGAREEVAAAVAQLERTNAELVATNAKLEEAQFRLAEASKAQERLRISRDLHDGMGNQLTALSLQLDLLGRLVDGPAAEHLAAAKILAADVLRDTRDVVSHLRGGRGSARDEIARLARALPRPRTSLDLAEGLDTVAPAVAETVVRLVQEGLTNVARHSDADNAWVVVRCEADAINLQVTDDGYGSADIVPGNGLAGMRERAALVGGELGWSSAPGEGFTVTARLPLRPSAVGG